MILKRSNRWVPLVSFALLSIGISAAAYYFYYSTAIDFYRQAQDQISSVASMKVKDLFDWRQRHFHDAELVLQDKDMVAKLRRMLGNPESQPPDSLKRELGTVAKIHGYASFRIYDSSMRLRLSSGKYPAGPDNFKLQLQEALLKKLPRFSDFYYLSDSEETCFDLIVPLLDGIKGEGSEVIGLLLLAVDNKRFMMPLIQSWPTPSQSAKIMIASINGDEIMVMNELEEGRNARLAYKRPIGGKFSSVFNEEARNEGVFEGYDYRDKKVLRAVKHVPESPWYIIAQVEADEIYAPLKIRAWAMAVTSLALILICGIRLVIWWENVKGEMYRQIIKNVRERENAEASLRRSEERISKINQCLLGLGNDYAENVNRLTALCGELTGATCALYNNMQEGMLYSLGQWKTPADYKASDKAEGHICYDLIRRGAERDMMYVPDLSKTDYARTDPNVKAYDLHSYLGHVVKCEGMPVGSLCIVFQKEFTPNDSDYKILGVIATAIGNEERSLVYEKALTASIERFTQIADNAGEWIWEVDTNGMFTYSNRVVENIYGYKPDELVGRKHYYDFFAPEEKDRLVMELDEMLGSRAPFKNFLSHNLHKNGRKILSECTAVPFYNSKGGFMGYRAVEFDITERRQLEVERLKVETLRTVELLAKGIAHDFNNLLASILGNISVVKVRLKNDIQTRKILDDSEHACVLARNLTGRLLTFAKETKTVKRPLNIVPFVSDSVTFALRGSNVAAEFMFEKEEISVEADESQISQLLHNLVINAVQAMPDGGKLKVGCALVQVAPREIPGLAGGSYARIMLKDGGQGISQENLGRIFDPYFSTKSKGSGLGLPTSMSIARNHGGTIIAESEEGNGASFFIYFPLSEKTCMADAGTERAPLIDNKFKSKILIMDDEQMVRDMLTRILEYYGCEVVQAAHGKEALDTYRKAQEQGSPFHLVIMDLTIPGGMGGREAIGELLKIDPAAKAVVSSGYSVELPDYRQLGFKAIVNKPYTLPELNKVLKELL
ncbi:MAG: PAS domain S-box protein [Victivallales bacterium]